MLEESMKERWLPVGILAGGLFLVNIVARIVVLVAAGKDDGKQITIGLWALIGVGAVMIPVAYWWARRYPMARVLGDLAVAVVAACLLAVIVGPFVSGTRPFRAGVGTFLLQVLYFVGVSAGGVLFGLLAVMTAGQDYKSRSWKRYTDSVRAKPPKPIRR
jgi:hypothetical protein